MTNEQAKDVLLNYTCCCKYGVSPVNCSDEECDFGKAVKTLCERPQGKWIGIEEYDDYPNKKVCECSECGKMIYILHNDFPNFCENCGAKMKGGAEE